MRNFGLLAMASMLAACADHHSAALVSGASRPPVRDRNVSTFSDVPAPSEAETPEMSLSREGAGNPPGGPAPEPGTILLFGTGLLAVALTQRRKLAARAPDEAPRA